MFLRLEHEIINPWKAATALPMGEWPLWSEACLVYTLLNQGFASLNAMALQFRMDVVEATNLALLGRGLVGQRAEALSTGRPSEVPDRSSPKHVRGLDALAGDRSSDFGGRRCAAGSSLRGAPGESFP